MIFYIDRKKDLNSVGCLNINKKRMICRSAGGKVPEIISFTDFLRWNYTVEYGQYIRKAIKRNEVPVPCDGKFDVLNVAIVKAFYDKLDCYSFAMYVICEVHFFDHAVKMDNTLQYYVTGYHSFNGYSDYLTDVNIYSGQNFHLRNQLDDFLVPYIRAAKYDNLAYYILQNYQPEALEGPCMVDVQKLVEAMGYEIQYAQLLPTDTVCAKTIFKEKEVIVYENGRAVKRVFKDRTIIVTTKSTADFLMNVLHECVHIEYHWMFYMLQYYYRAAIKAEAPDFEDFFMSEEQQDTLRSMEIQANAISSRIAIYSENLDIVISEFKDKQGRDIFNTDLIGYEQLIERITGIFGAYRNTSKKRLLHKGFKKARGVFEWGDEKYAEAHLIPDDFPNDWTYTLPIEDMSKILGTNLTYDKLVYSGHFVYADGHLCFNDPQYVYQSGEHWLLTEYAKHNMAKCCLPFKRVYGKKKYKYTFGELNNELETRFYERVFSEQQMQALEKSREEYLLSLLTVEYKEGDKIKTRKMTRGETVKFLIDRAEMTSAQVAEAADCSVEALTALRSEKEYTPRLGTMLAFFTALDLEEVYRNELLIMTKLISYIDSDEYKTYLWFRKTVPGFTVYQANNYLRSKNKTPWTTGYKPRKKAQKAV